MPIDQGQGSETSGLQGDPRLPGAFLQQSNNPVGHVGESHLRRGLVRRPLRKRAKPRDRLGQGACLNPGLLQVFEHGLGTAFSPEIVHRVLNG